MHILIYKTNIRYKRDVRNIAPIINNIASITGWHIDRADIDRVLRIEATDNDTEAIRNQIRYAGYFCEELA